MTKRHFELTDKLIKKMSVLTSALLRQGVSEGDFEIKGNINLINGFIIYGLSCVFDMNLDLDNHSLDEIKGYINKLIGRIK